LPAAAAHATIAGRMTNRTGTGCLVAIAVAGACGAQAPAAPPSPPSQVVARDGKHCRVEFHRGALPEALAGRLADDALAAAESGWPLLDRRLGIRCTVPPRLHVFADANEFQRAGESRLVSRGEFASADATAGFVRMAPAMSVPVLEVAGLPWPTCRAVLRQAVRTSVAQQLPGVDPNEDWTVALLVYSISEDTVDPARKPGVDAGRDDRRFQWGGEWGRKQQIKELVENCWPDTPIEERENALAVLAEFLHVANQGASRQLLDAAQRKYPMRVDAQRGAAEAVLGRDWKKSQERFTKFVGGLHPVWQEVVPMLDLRGKRWLLASEFGAKMRLAHAYRNDPVPAGNYGVHCVAELVTAESEFRLVLDSDGKSALLVRVLPEEVRIDAWEVPDKSPAVARAERQTPPGKPFAFDVDIGDGSLQVAIDGRQVCSWPYGKRDMHRGWGIAAQDGVWVTDFGCRALPQSKK
jgi:hypothetical protein